MKLINTDDIPYEEHYVPDGDTQWEYKKTLCVLKDVIDQIPSVDAVSREQYEELREAFIDFVCSGIHNPALYCKNRCDECVNGYGYCTYKRCNGFDPDGRVYE